MVAPRIYSERINIGRKGKYGLQLRTILWLLYVTGSIGTFIAILSKYIVTPMVEQLSYERCSYLQSARKKCMCLNFSMARLASRVPSSNSIKKGYCDSVCQTVDTRFGIPKSKPAIEESQDWNLFQSIVQDKQNMHDSGIEKGITKKSDDLMEQIRKINYTTSKYYSTYGGADSDNKSVFREVRKELRELKGKVLTA